MITDTQVWYEIQYTTRGENDWFSQGKQSDTADAAREYLAGRRPMASLEYRIVKVTRTEETLDNPALEGSPR